MSPFHLGFCLGRFSLPSRTSADSKRKGEKKRNLIGFLASLATHDRPLEVNKPPITQVGEGGF